MPKAPGRDGLLADIRGGARLKKVSESEKRDRSGAAVPGAEPASPAPGGGGGAAAGGAAAGGMAGALASALAARKAKVSHSGEYFPPLVLREMFSTEVGLLMVLQMTRRMMMIGELVILVILESARSLYIRFLFCYLRYRLFVHGVEVKNCCVVLRFTYGVWAGLTVSWEVE